MGTTLKTGFNPTIDLLYTELSKKCSGNHCGWKITENKGVKIWGIGFTEDGDKFSIEISDENADGFITIDAWEYEADYSPNKEYPLELEEKRIRKDKNKLYIQKIFDYLQLMFPGPWLDTL